MQYKKTQKTLPVIARELGVDYVLEGRIRWEKSKEGGKIRYTLRLIKVSGDLQLWAETNERTLADIFNLQRDIASRVVTSLGLVLAEGERDALAAIPTGKLDAYQAYLRGQVLMKRSEETNIKGSIEMFERAVGLDSALPRRTQGSRRRICFTTGVVLTARNGVLYLPSRHSTRHLPFSLICQRPISRSGSITI